MSTLIALFALALLAVAGAQWTAPTAISTLTGTPTQPESMVQSIAAAPDGSSVHVVWQLKTGTDTAIYYRRQQNGVWDLAEKRLSPAAPQNDGFPYIAISGNYLHVSFYRGNVLTAGSATYYIQSTNLGNTWQPEQFINYTSWWSGVTVSGSHVFLASQQQVTSTNSEVFLYKSTNNGGTWPPPLRVTYAPDRSEDPSIATSGQYVYMAWNDKSSGLMQCEFGASSDYGASFAIQKQVSASASASGTYSPNVGASGSSVVVSWEDTSYVYFVVSSDNGNTFSAIKQLSTTAAIYPTGLIYSPDIHFIWGGPFASQVYYTHSTDNGVTFSNPVVVMDIGSSGTNLLQIPSMVLAATTNTLYATWATHSDNKVYFAQDLNANGGGPLAARVEFTHHSGAGSGASSGGSSGSAQARSSTGGQGVATSSTAGQTTTTSSTAGQTTTTSSSTAGSVSPSTGVSAASKFNPVHVAAIFIISLVTGIRCCLS